LTRRIDQLLAEDAEITAELDLLEEEVRQEAEAKPISVDPPGPGVPAFQLEGSWRCDVQSAVPDGLTGPLGHMVITFEVTGSNTMTGSIAWPGRQEHGQAVQPEPIQGEAMLFQEHHATIHGGDRYDRVWLQGVVGPTQFFNLEIPVHKKLGNVYHGSDTQGRQYALRLIKASETRYGF
jgi:hypothetical protein